jgi:hypothetical protein
MFTEKIMPQVFFINVSPSYSALYKSNILISGKMLNEVKYENFHGGLLTATMADADVTKIPHAACEFTIISSLKCGDYAQN